MEDGEFRSLNRKRTLFLQGAFDLVFYITKCFFKRSCGFGVSIVKGR